MNHESDELRQEIAEGVKGTPQRPDKAPAPWRIVSAVVTILKRRPAAAAVRRSNKQQEERPLLPVKLPGTDGASSPPDKALDRADDQPGRVESQSAGAADPNDEQVQNGDTHGGAAPADDELIREQERCAKYSQKALVFAVSTFTAYAVSSSSSSSTASTATFEAAMAAFLVTVCADLFSWGVKPKWSPILVYLSSFHLALMTALIFASFNSYDGYALLVVPLMIGAALLQHMMLPEEDRRRAARSIIDNKDTIKSLDDVFETSSNILNGGGLASAVIVIIGRFVSAEPDRHAYAASLCASIGFLFFLTVLVAIYLMLVTTVRIPALALHAKYPFDLLRVLFVATLVATFIMFMIKVQQRRSSARN